MTSLTGWKALRTFRENAARSSPGLPPRCAAHLRTQPPLSHAGFPAPDNPAGLIANAFLPKTLLSAQRLEAAPRLGPRSTRALLPEPIAPRPRPRSARTLSTPTAHPAPPQACARCRHLQARPIAGSGLARTVRDAAAAPGVRPSGVPRGRAVLCADSPRDPRALWGAGLTYRPSVRAVREMTAHPLRTPKAAAPLLQPGTSVPDPGAPAGRSDPLGQTQLGIRLCSHIIPAV